MVRSTWSAAGAVVVISGVASAGLLDFSGLQHGEVIGNQFQASDGVTISAVNFNRPFDLAIAFDSNLSGTADPDLESPWNGGNLPSNTDLGMLMILATNNTDQDNNGIIDNPNDEGNRPAGQFILDFSTDQNEFGFDLVDVESINAEDGSVEFFSSGSSVGMVGFADFVDNMSAHYRPGVSYGDNSANTISPLTAAEVGFSSFDRVVITLGGSGGVDNVHFVPTPATGMILTAGAAGFLRRRRR